MPRYDDSRPYDITTGEQPVFSPELQSEKMREIQEAAVVMQKELARAIRTLDWSIDDLYELIWTQYAVRAYLNIAGDTLGRPFVKVAFSMAIRNYIDSKE